MKMPTRAGFVKGNFSNDSSSIKINNNSKFKNKEAIYKKDSNNVLSYSGYISKINSNEINFDYNTKQDLNNKDFLYNDDGGLNKATCLLGTNYYYETTPKLEITDKIIILREILEKRQDYNYLNDNDVKYLNKLLLFLEREFFGKEYKKSETGDLSNNKLDENYFLDKIFTKEEALKMLENVIIEAYKRKGSFNINSKLSEVYAENYYTPNDYYKPSEERNILSPTKRVYNPPKEVIPCPLKPQEKFIKEDNRTLDDYMMNPLDCVDKHYMDSFNNSFI
jgi:hypothetical protein